MTAHCAKCGAAIGEPANTKPEDRKKCPACGSTTRRIEVGITETLSMKAKVGLKAKHPGGKKPHSEGISGDDLHRKSGKWMKIERLIDREKDQYREVVTDPETGQEIHRCEEPLSKHTGHGTPKKKHP